MMVRAKSKHLEAIQWRGDNLWEMQQWLSYAFVEGAPWSRILIENRDGRVVVRPGDWVVRLDGTFAVYEPILFNAAYEVAA